MRKLLIATVTIVVLLPALTHAWNVPDSFVGIPFGGPAEVGVATLKQRAMASFPPRCETGPEQVWCEETGIKIGIPTLIGTFRFNATGFYHASGWFLSSTYDLVKSTFIEKYGRPTSTSKQMVTSQRGTAFENESLEWTSDTVVIRLSRFGSQLDMGRFEVITKVADDERAERMKELLQKGKSGL